MRLAVPVYCRCTPAEAWPFFHEAGLVHYQHRALGAEVVDGIGA